MNILIAEDDATSRLILESIVSKWHYTPVSAKNGKEAWKIMQSDDAPRLAILDWQMPGMSGVELCQKIRAIDTSDPAYLVILTSKDEKKDIVNALEAGANDFLSKPYNTEELRARLNVGKRMLDLQSALENAYKALEYEAMHDPLTGIYNRRAILKLLEKEMAWAQREKRELYLGMCDLDHFKQINDTYGHQTGDEVLTAFTRIIQSGMRKHDHLGRYGGEEFLIISRESGDGSSLALFDRLRKLTRDTPVSVLGKDISFTVSIGVSCYHNGQTTDQFLDSADLALYKAKQEGRNQIIYNGK